MFAGAEARLQRQQAAAPQEVRPPRRLQHGEGSYRTQARRPLPPHATRREPVLARGSPPHDHMSSQYCRYPHFGNRRYLTDRMFNTEKIVQNIPKSNASNCRFSDRIFEAREDCSGRRVSEKNIYISNINRNYGCNTERLFCRQNTRDVNTPRNCTDILFSQRRRNRVQPMWDDLRLWICENQVYQAHFDYEIHRSHVPYVGRSYLPVASRSNVPIVRQPDVTRKTKCVCVWISSV